MRIIVVMTRFSPWAQPIALALQSRGHDVHVFDFHNDLDDGHVSPDIPGVLADYEKFISQMAGIHIVDSPRLGRGIYLWAAPVLRRLARNVRADMILTLYGGGFALMAYVSGFRPYCVYVVGSDVLRVGRLERGINRITLTCAARVFANGEYLASRAHEQAPGAIVMPLLLGVDPTKFEPATPAAGAVQFVCTRFFAPVYNNAAIIRAVAKIPEDTRPFRVVFTSRGELLHDCRSLADRLLPAAIRDRVQFLGGVSYERLLQELRRSHAFLSFSRSDGTATSILEGMASGLYPILSDIPQNRALIKQGQSVGILVRLDDDAALVDALIDVVRHAPERAEAARQNRHFIASVANRNVNGRILAQEIEAAASGGR